LVFVQSVDRSTAGDPRTFGGGPTDTHLIYEGLTRVAADAVLLGAGSLHADAFFSVWHPEFVAMRRSLGLARHPVQIVVSKKGPPDFGALLFNVPNVPVFLIAGQEAVVRHAKAFSARPWIRHIALADDNLQSAIDHLRVEERIHRISAIGGRTTASGLVDAGLAQDIYLTTTSSHRGEPGTPWYCGSGSPRLRVITRKEWVESGSPVVFEHILID
jgi:riboflavin biosynthesis pyrimidine reductase